MHNFLQTILNGTMYGFSYSLIAIGYTMIFGTLKLVNIAHGEVIMAGTFIGLSMMLLFKGNLLVAFLTSVIVSAFVGVLVERVCFKPLRKTHELAPLISTMGAGILLTEIFIKFYTSDVREFPNPFTYAGFNIGGFYFRASYVFTMIMSLILVFCLYLLINKTKLGRSMRTVSENIKVSYLLGVNVDRIFLITFALASGVGGVAGCLIGIGDDTISPTMGVTLTVKGLIVIVLGSMGNFPGAVVGGVLLGIVEFIGVFLLSTSARDAFAFVILIFILLVKPSGLFEKAPPREV